MGTVNDEHARYPDRDDAATELNRIATRNREPATPVDPLVEHVESEFKDYVRWRGNISVYMNSRISSERTSGSSSSAPKLTGTARCQSGDAETVYQVDGEEGATMSYDHIVSKRQRRY